MNTHLAAPPSQEAVSEQRRVVHRSRGTRHGPIVRMVSPSDLGELVKPFVFLDYFDVDGASAPNFGFHPHSGIATLTLLFEGGSTYRDSTGASGMMQQGSVEWMQAGGGVWHTGKGVGKHIRGFQLWLALPPGLESGPAASRYLGPEQFLTSGPARVILGTLDGVSSPIIAPASITYIDVRLHDGEAWQYQPPPGHDVAWIAVYEGSVLVPQAIAKGDLAIFAEEHRAIKFEARGSARFVLGSAVKHPHDLVLGRYSVHTDADALRQGETTIRRIGKTLSIAS